MNVTEAYIGYIKAIKYNLRICYKQFVFTIIVIKRDFTERKIHCFLFIYLFALSNIGSIPTGNYNQNAR